MLFTAALYLVIKTKLKCWRGKKTFITSIHFICKEMDPESNISLAKCE
jgi:hypothetical protein